MEVSFSHYSMLPFPALNAFEIQEYELFQVQEKVFPGLGFWLPEWFVCLFIQIGSKFSGKIWI